MKNTLLIIVGMCLSTVLFQACTANQETGPSTQQLLEGRWELDSASKNGNPTAMLEGAYFEFTLESKMTTNLLGSDETSPFALKDKIIQQKSFATLNYEIKKLNTDSLQLLTTIQKVNFDLLLLKKTD